MIKISVIICSHNPRPDYLHRVLDALKSQTFAEEWELLLIDNASNPILADRVDLSWQSANTRHVREEEIGLTPARLRGIREAQGELLVFVDDDNVLDSEYLERAWNIFLRQRHLGAFGAGALQPEFEIKPSAALLPQLSMLAIRTVPSPVWSNNYEDASCIPWGAGLCVRRGVAQRYLEVVGHLSTIGVLDRRGQQLFCGGDDLFSWVAVGQGYGFGLFPELRLLHLISSPRLDPKYLLRLIHDHAFSHAVLACLLIPDREPWRLSDSMFRILLHGLRRGSFSMSCRWAAFTGARHAANFVAERQLRPLGEVFHIDSRSSFDVGGSIPEARRVNEAGAPIAKGESL